MGTNTIWKLEILILLLVLPFGFAISDDGIGQIQPSYIQPKLSWLQSVLMIVSDTLAPNGQVCDSTSDANKIFNNTADTMEIGSICGSTSNIWLYSCANADCSSYFSMGNKFKVNGVIINPASSCPTCPQWSGLGIGNRYRYFCYDCGDSTSGSCSDSDGNKNPNVFGRVTDKYGINHMDSCQSSDSLLEYYCSGNEYLSYIVPCQCISGACVQTTCTFGASPDGSCKCSSTEGASCSSELDACFGYGCIGGKITKTDCVSDITQSCQWGSDIITYKCIAGKKVKTSEECAPCPTDWKCSEWSTCSNEQQTRTCTDSNNCGNLFSRPALTQSCEKCGDGICSGNEKPSTCSDCKTCDYNNNCDSGETSIFCQDCKDDGSGSGGGTTTYIATTSTLTEYYSTSIEKLIKQDAICSDTMQCKPKIGYKVECDLSKSEDVYNYFYAKCDENAGFVNEIIRGAFFIFGNIFGDKTDFCVGFADYKSNFNKLGMCIAKSESSMGMVWDGTLNIIGGFGLPTHYVLLTTIGILILLGSFIFQQISK